MGVLTFGLVLYLIKTARSRFMRASGNEVDHAADMDTADGKSKSREHSNKVSDTKWVDGLRGIAAVGVVSSHICLSFWQQLATPTVGGRDSQPMLFQRPILRLVTQAHAFVALFLILMGFVTSLKPLRQARANQYEEALLAIARSILNRMARLVLPASAATVLAWAAWITGFNQVALKSDGYWLRHTSQEMAGSLAQALNTLRRALIETWTIGGNLLDEPQWALKGLLTGSFCVSLVLLITITTRPIFRTSVLLTAYFYSWISGDFMIGTNVYFGVLLAQLHTLSTTSSTGPSVFQKEPIAITRFLPLFSAILGLYLMSYPSGSAADAAWSRSLETLAGSIAPADTDIARFWASIGGQILCLSISCSHTLQHLFTHQIPCYLGSVSFSIYLLHGPLIRSILAMLVFGPTALRGVTIDVDGEIRYPMPAKWTFLFALPVFALVLLACVHLWAMKMEPLFAKMTKAIEDFATGGRERPHSSLHLAIERDKRKASIAENIK